MIPVCLVTGFLGSGKTTFLRHIIDLKLERIAYLVNEFSPLDVDGQLLRHAAEDVVTVSGGSIFCKCLVTEFIDHLTRIPERFDSPQMPLQGVVIEASGIANPMVIEQMLSETGLDETYEVTLIVTVVDPGSLPKLIHTLPNIRAQIESADVVLLNKTDQFGPQEIEEAESIVREISPQAQLIRTVRCQADLDLFGRAGRRGLEGDYAPCADPNFAQFSIEFVAFVDIDKLKSVLEACAGEIFRAKGIVPTSDGNCYVDMSSGGITFEASDDERARSGLVVITRGGGPDRIGSLSDTLRQAEVASLAH